MLLPAPNKKNTKCKKYDHPVYLDELLPSSGYAHLRVRSLNPVRQSFSQCRGEVMRSSKYEIKRVKLLHSF